MREGVVLFLALLLFIFLAAVLMLAQEQPEPRPVTIKSSDVNNGVVILAVREGKSSFELQCNQGMSGCAVLVPGNYTMLRLPKNRGVYQCTNVEMYRTTSGSDLGDRIGQYCLVE